MKCKYFAYKSILSQNWIVNDFLMTSMIGCWHRAFYNEFTHCVMFCNKEIILKPLKKYGQWEITPWNFQSLSWGKNIWTIYFLTRPKDCCASRWCILCWEKMLFCLLKVLHLQTNLTIQEILSRCLKKGKHLLFCFWHRFCFSGL